MAAVFGYRLLFYWGEILRNFSMQLSVVIPIYNVERYLAECLESVRRQSIFEELEVLLIDDGSTDMSSDIASAFAAGYANVTYIHQVNSGLGAARNAGLALASSEYVTFLDSDDRVTPTAYELMLEPFRNKSIHVVVGRMATFPVETSFYWDAALKYGSRRWAGVGQMPALIHSASACNKIFRMSKVDELGAKFAVGVHFEDAYFVLPMLVASPVISVVDDVVYEYRKRLGGGSIMDGLFTKRSNYWDYIQLIEFLMTFSEMLSGSESKRIHEFIVRGFQGFVLRAPDMLEGDELRSFTQRAFDVVRKISVEDIRRMSHDNKHRVAFANLLSDGFAGFDSWNDPPRRVKLIGDRPYYGYQENRPENALRSSSGITVSIEAISRNGLAKEVVIEGRITSRGLPMHHRPDIEIVMLLGKRKFGGNWVARRDRLRSDGLWSGFIVRVPAKKWPVGEYFPRFVLTSTGGALNARALKTVAFFRNSSAFSVAGKRFTCHTNEKNQVGVLSERAESSHRWKVRLSGAIDDYRAFQKKQPLASMRLLRLATRPLFRGDVWLVGERWDMAQDNGAALFKYASTVGMKNVYYVAERHTEGFRTMRRFGKVVASGSLRHKIVLVNASILANAFDVDTYIIPRAWNRAEFVEFLLPHLAAKRVFLQHGVTYRDVAQGLHRLVQGYDAVLVSSERERRYFAEDLNYGTRAVLTGMPRFDSLVPAREGRRLLFAPTWRSYLVSPSYVAKGAPAAVESFQASEYYKMLLAVMSDERLLEAMERSNVVLDFLPHYEVANSFVKALSALPNVNLVDQNEVNFQDVLRSCSLFLTDYSSTMFDVAYMGTPLVSFAFDEDEFDQGHTPRGDFDLEVDGFGPVARTVDEVVGMLLRYISGGFVREPFYDARAASYFGHVDSENGQRVVQQLKELSAS